MPVTIKDVAERANVSISTVSAVVNDSKYVSPRLRAQVERAIEELGYIPSRVGRALSSKRSSMIAHMIPAIANPFFAALIQAAESAAFHNGYNLLVCSSEGDPAKMRQHQEFLLGAGVDGVLISPSTRLPLEDQCAPFIERGIPVVVVAGSLAPPGVDAVLSDNERGIRQLTQYLIDLGHTRIAYLGRRDSKSSEMRREAIATCMAEAGLELRAEMCRAAAPYVEFQATYHLARSLIMSRPRPTAIMCYNDSLAMGVLQACYDLGLRVPQDLSVTGFDDSLGHLTSPPLTTLAVPAATMGRLAIDILMGRVNARGREKESSPPERHVYEPELIVRASTGPAPAAAAGRS